MRFANLEYASLKPYSVSDARGVSARPIHCRKSTNLSMLIVSSRYCCIEARYAGGDRQSLGFLTRTLDWDIV